jgi:hypothetical protein
VKLPLFHVELLLRMYLTLPPYTLYAFVTWCLGTSGTCVHDEMDRACSTNGSERNAYRILVGSQKKRDQYEDQGVGGWIILKWFL